MSLQRGATGRNFVNQQADLSFQLGDRRTDRSKAPRSAPQPCLDFTACLLREVGDLQLQKTLQISRAVVHRSPVYVHCLVLLKLYLSMGMRGNPEGRLASKVALLCCALLFIFSVLSLAAGNSSGRDRSGEQTPSCELMLYLFFLSEFLTLLMAFAAAEITSWRTKFDPQVSSSSKPSRSQVEDK